MKKRTLLGLLAALPLSLLTACGGNSGNDATVRLVNASPGYASLDLYWDDSQKISSVGFGTVSDSVGLKNGSYTMALTSAGSSTELLTTSRSLESGKKYAIVAYGWEGSLKSVSISEDVDAADSGKTSVSVLNTSTDAGDLDFYLTGQDDSLDASTPVRSSVSGGSRSSFSTVTSGTYRLRVTAAGDTSDVRLDVSNVTIDSKAVVTFILTPTTGGVLVNSLQFNQGGSLVKQLTTKARARVVAAMANGSAVSLSAGGTSLSASSKSPAIKDYALIDAGTLTVNTSVDGNSLGSKSITFAAGSDTTLVVSGSNVAGAKVTAITDDNRLPTTSTKYKIRLLHVSPSLQNDTLTLSIDLSDVTSDQGYLAQPTYQTRTASSSSDIAVSALSTNSTIFTTGDNPVEMVAKGVYTMFVYDTAANAPTGKLKKER